MNTRRRGNEAMCYVGPQSRTVTQFWQMIWQENVRCVVMATSLFQHAKVQMHASTV